ncbi:DUF2507 domain-containing protein [Aureibacillus halotolerans]|uniref:Uncharacterized protein DUF2507 n=1 Tax=Aureibacillus halotolerans TaxID=1508390 RepID=A0A4R6U3U3_9BACI|nr:DUF2507 domain-containing protein [Aureibacillus halotolerans]TDQ39179.1 uncharacterized protein DUF2507 [Aureibacillus halotolerans]
MSNQSQDEKNENDVQVTATPFSIRLLRQELLPELLGEQQQMVLYYSGKRLARKFPLETLDECPVFFHKAEWGQLRLIKQKKSQLIFELSNSLLLEKKNHSPQALFSLEAGFLAETVASIMNGEAEATVGEATRDGIVPITVEWYAF